MSNFSLAQTKQLLAPIRPQRVLKDGKGMSHVSQQDITAHLIRVFGFGNFTTELLNVELVAEVCNDTERPYKEQKWNVIYRAVVRLTIFNDKHEPVCSYEDASCGDAQNQVRHDAHDLALKSAISLAKKRTTINLGDQFGLSLYNKGQMDALVRGTHVVPKGFYDEVTEEKKDVQEGVPQQEALGTDESIHNDHLNKGGDAEPTDEQERLLADSLGAKKIEETAR